MTGPDAPWMALKGKHSCVSFAHPQQLEAVAEICQTFCLDNGAFSAWRGGKALDLDGLARWLDDWVRHPGFDFAFCPDVIDGSAEDNALMRAKWFKTCSRRVWNACIPVWHLNEPVELLREFMAAHDRIAIGSAGAYSQIATPQWWQRMSQALDVVCDEEGYPLVKLHGLRQLDPRITSLIPYASADSCNVARNIGIDAAWTGSHVPKSKLMRAQILMSNIEHHATARRWTGQQGGAGHNMELFG